VKEVLVVTCLVGLLGASTLRGWCNATTLSQATNRAAEATRDGQPLAALSCYRAFRDDTAFDAAESTVQERFLSEYLDHARNLASHARGKFRREYLREAHEIANAYIEWFMACRPASQRAVTHVRAVIFYLGDADVTIHEPDRVLSDYERLAARFPVGFSNQAIELWDEVLRTTPGATRYLEDSQARERAAGDGTYRRHWESFRAFLGFAEARPETVSIAREYLRHIHAILSE
jgi:hypothetical protein